MAKKESPFRRWFILQHGKRTDRSPVRFKKMSDRQLRALVLNGREAEAELRRREEWDKRYESALYAWQAREKV